jgi:RHS repeat-associated protein
MGFAGQLRMNTENQLIYLRARTYDPVTAQFLSVDPIVGATGEPYSYAADNPVNVIDPAGLDADELECPPPPCCLEEHPPPVDHTPPVDQQPTDHTAAKPQPPLSPPPPELRHPAFPFAADGAAASLALPGESHLPVDLGRRLAKSYTQSLAKSAIMGEEPLPGLISSSLEEGASLLLEESALGVAGAETLGAFGTANEVIDVLMWIGRGAFAF